MKKILFIIYTASLGGGAEKILTNVVNGLAKNADYDISVLEYAKYNVKKEKFDPKVKILPPVVEMEKANRLEKVIKFFLVHFCPSLLRSFFIKEKYDVEISFNYQISSFLTSSKKDVYNIQWNHGDIYDLRESRIKYFLQKKSYKKANKIVTISENTKNSVLELFPEYRSKVVTIYNGTDVDAILAAAEEHTETVLEPNSLVFLGRLEDNKNPLKLIQYVKDLICEGLPIHLYLLGAGVQEEEIAAYIKAENLEEDVVLLGYQKNPYPIIKQSRAVCMLSKSEGFPTVFTEGLALGKPFISSRIGGTAELSNGGRCGIIISSYEEFKNAVNEIISDENHYAEMSAACREHIKRFSYKKQINDIITLIEEA